MDALLQEYGLILENNRLVTARDVKAGTVLLKQDPLALIPLNSVRQRRCNFCTSKARRLQHCSQCRSAYFCSKECFCNAWARFHVKLCSPQEKDPNTHVDNGRWLLERTAWTMYQHRQGKLSNSPPADWLVKLFDSLPIRDDESQPSYPMNDDIDTALSQHFDDKSLSAIWQRIQYSLFDITDQNENLDKVGYGIYPLTAHYVPHSCWPNSATVYGKGSQSLVAISDIPAGTPITINYVDLTLPRAQREEALARRFGPDFQCQCPRCQGHLASIDMLLEHGQSSGVSEADAELQVSEQLEEWSILRMTEQYSYHPDGSPKHRLDMPHFTHYVGRMMVPSFYEQGNDTRRSSTRVNLQSKQERMQAERRCKQAMDALVSVPELPGLSQSYIRAAQKLLRQRINSNRWVEAARLCVYLIVIYRLYFPILHPVLVVQYAVMARATWNAMIELELVGINRRLERVYEQGTLVWLSMAQSGVKCIFGPDGELQDDLVRLQWVVQRDQSLKAPLQTSSSST